MKTSIRILFAVVAILPVLVHADYKSDWNYANFYQEVNECRTAIVLPSGKDYEAAGLKHGQSKEALRNEVLATTPLFESIATVTCYCALNELAKDMSLAEYKRNQQAISSYMQTPRCKARATDAVKILKDKNKAASLKLQ